jgi:GNAT superfamily N-acetyltransferase
MSLVGKVGWPHRPEDVAPALSLGRVWRATEQRGGNLLGLAVWWPMEPNAGRVGLVIVSPHAQGRGIGRSLMNRVLQDTGSRSLKLLATKEGQPLYENLGFKSVGRSQRHQGLFQGPPTPHESVERAGIDEVAVIQKIDEQVLGVNRSEILHHLARAGDVNVLRANGKISGFAIVRPFGAGHLLGPLVAENESDALVLLRATVKPGELRVDRFTDAERLGEKLVELGLAGHETTNVMVRGDWPTAESAVRGFTMASHAWG